MIPWVQGTTTKWRTITDHDWEWWIMEVDTPLACHSKHDRIIQGTLIKHALVQRVYCYCVSILCSGSGSMWCTRRHGRGSEKLGGTMGIASVTLKWKPHRRWPAADVSTIESTIV